MRSNYSRRRDFAFCVLASFLGAGVTGCLVPGYTVVPPLERVEVAPSGKALVILLFPSKFGEPPANLFLDDRYIGTLRTNTHLAITLDPGEYRFMVFNDNIAMMDASVKADKTYHAYVRTWFRLVGGKLLHAFEPFDGPDAKLQEWYSISEQVVPDANGAKFGARALERWRKKLPAFRAEWGTQEERAHLHVPTSH